MVYLSSSWSHWSSHPSLQWLQTRSFLMLISSFTYVLGWILKAELPHLSLEVATWSPVTVNSCVWVGITVVTLESVSWRSFLTIGLDFLPLPLETFGDGGKSRLKTPVRLENLAPLPELSLQLPSFPIWKNFISFRIQVRWHIIGLMLLPVNTFETVQCCSHPFHTLWINILVMLGFDLCTQCT